MKTNFLKITLIASAFTAMVSCVEDTDYNTPPFPDCADNTLVKNKEVTEIPATAVVAQYAGDDIIEAYVTSSDEGGNFFKSISFQTLDGKKGFSVPVEKESYFTSFEPGRKVYIKMKNLYTDAPTTGAIGMRIGDLFVSSTGAASVGRIPATQVGKKLFASCTKVSEEQLVRKMTIAEAKKDENLNTLIELDGVQFEDRALGKTYYDSANLVGGSTNINLVDIEGNGIIFRTGTFSRYAGQLVQSGNGKIRGVLTKFNNDYQFMVRTEKDIQLTGKRITPIFSQNFESITATGNNQFIGLPGWTNVSMNSGAEKWEARIFSNNKYAQFSAFQTGETNVDARLITPAINLNNTTDESLRFGFKTGFYNGVALTVWYSTDYDGSGTVAAVNAATWTQLPISKIPTVTDNSFAANFYSSGLVDLSAISGNVHIAFKYVGSSTGITTTYQVDNIEVYGK